MGFAVGKVTQGKALLWALWSTPANYHSTRNQHSWPSLGCSTKHCRLSSLLIQWRNSHKSFDITAALMIHILWAIILCQLVHTLVTTKDDLDCMDPTCPQRAPPKYLQLFIIIEASYSKPKSSSTPLRDPKPHATVEVSNWDLSLFGGNTTNMDRSSNTYQIQPYSVSCIVHKRWAFCIGWHIYFIHTCVLFMDLTVTNFQW